MKTILFILKNNRIIICGMKKNKTSEMHNPIKSIFSDQNAMGNVIYHNRQNGRWSF